MRLQAATAGQHRQLLGKKYFSQSDWKARECGGGKYLLFTGSLLTFSCPDTCYAPLSHYSQS